MAASVCSLARDLALIVNKGNQVKALTSAELAKLSSGVLAWPSGGKVTFVLRDPSNPAVKPVLEKVFGISAERLKATIATNPSFFVVVDSDSTVIRMVESLPGAVGLIDIYSVTSGVNVVRVNGKLPLEPGYVMHGN
ncbi:MAG: hypothetical protein ACR2IF_05815 [Terriglobales bacterium]